VSEAEPQFVSSPQRAIRVKTSTGWADLAIQGAPGAPGLPRFDYLGAWSAAGTYQRGQIVIRNGITFECVRDTTTQPPASWPSVQNIPVPVVNGQWLKGVGGALAWQAIAKADLPLPLAATDVTGLVVADTDWHYVGMAGEPGYLNGWSAYDGSQPSYTAGSYPGARFRKSADGWVHLSGLVKCSAAGGSPIFTLPAGYRPRFILHHGTVGNAAFAYVHTMASGDVQGNVQTAWISLDSIVFRAEQ